MSDETTQMLIRDMKEINKGLYANEKFELVKKILPTRLCENKKTLGIVRFHNLSCGRL